MRVCVYFSWQGAALITRHLVCASRIVEAIPVVLGKDSNCLRSPLPLPFCTLSWHSSFYTKTSFLLSRSPFNMMTPWKLLPSYLSHTHRHTPWVIASYVVLLIIISWIFFFSLRRLQLPWGQGPHDVFHFVFLVHITVPVNQTKRIKSRYTWKDCTSFTERRWRHWGWDALSGDM